MASAILVTGGKRKIFVFQHLTFKLQKLTTA